MTAVHRYSISTEPTEVQLPADAPLVAAGLTLTPPGIVDVWALDTGFFHVTRTLAAILTGEPIPDGWEYRLTTPRSAETGIVAHIIEQTPTNPGDDA